MSLTSYRAAPPRGDLGPGIGSREPGLAAAGPGARVVRGWRVPRAAAWSMFLWAPVGSAARVRWSGASGARERPRHDCCGGWSFGLPCLYSDDEEVGFARYQGLGSDVRFPGTWIPAPGCRVLFPGSC